jgi:uncharacterized protein YacL
MLENYTFTGMGFLIINTVAAIIGSIIAMAGVLLVCRELKKPIDGIHKRNDQLLISGLLLSSTGIVLVTGIIIACVFG